MRIDHRRAHAPVTEQLLHGTDAVAVLQQMDHKSMAETWQVAGWQFRPVSRSTYPRVAGSTYCHLYCLPAFGHFRPGARGTSTNPPFREIRGVPGGHLAPCQHAGKPGGRFARTRSSRQVYGVNDTPGPTPGSSRRKGPPSEPSGPPGSPNKKPRGACRGALLSPFSHPEEYPCRPTTTPRPRGRAPLPVRRYTRKCGGAGAPPSRGQLRSLI